MHEVVRGEGDLEQLAGIYAWPDADEPWIRANFVTTIDGRTRGGDGLSGSINTEADHRVFDLLRATCDAVVAGRGTVEAEGYRPIELSEEQQGIRASAGLSGTPPLVIPGVGPLPPLLRAGLSAGSVVHDPSAGANHAPAEWIQTLCREQGWRRILLEGGPSLMTAFLLDHAVDELCLSTAPTLHLSQWSGFARPVADLAPSGFTVASVVLMDDTVMTRWVRGDRTDRSEKPSR